MVTEERFDVEMARLMLVYGNQPTARLVEFQDCLRGLSDNELAYACQAWKRSPHAQWFPRPADLMDILANRELVTAPESVVRRVDAGEYDLAKTVVQQLTAQLPEREGDAESIAAWEHRLADARARWNAQGEEQSS